MNFFENQERARKQTRKLLILYFFAVIFAAGITAAGVNFFILNSNMNINLDTGQGKYLFTENSIFLLSFLICLGIILIASLFKILQLGKGGSYVAKATGATLVDLDTNDPLLRRYINTVEEMSIASGTPTPQVYVLENEASINAFAAGYEIDDAVVAVSRGALEQLNRDELQGVVAHEFSHIFNGDMKIGIRLIGYLFGLIVLKEIGYHLMRSGQRGRIRIGNSKNKDSAGGLVIVGIACFIASSIGVLFASLIKAAISRQREYLADASAVQFTRNPDGISGALKKIMTSTKSFKPKGPSEVAHLYFSHSFSGLFSTHPPLLNRIQTIDPSFRVSDFKEEVERDSKREMEERIEAEERVKRDAKKKKNNHFLEGLLLGSANQMQYAEVLLGSADSSLKTALRTINGAKAYIYYIFFQKSNIELKNQLRELSYYETKETIDYIKKYINKNIVITNELKLPLIDLSFPVLKRMSEDERKSFLINIKKIILNDQKMNKKEFITYSLIREVLWNQSKFQGPVYSKLQLKTPLMILYSFIAQLDQKISTDEFNKVTDSKLIEIAKIHLNEVTEALSKLKRAKPYLKQEILKKCVELIETDKKISFDEFELIRVLSEALLVPMPPIKAGEFN